ncbi:hypothetical protein TARUN_6759 [Trichoderma arundinaceum]|uniref:Uncharacterized protein n=1 Tax=Trichoderma arundinaceum TaxID=490622 RepID=A0A395NHB4_TRIAR|nr:hypothetical protein TARUN_6759 [Trichoderma arundinaceum]
MDTSIKDLKNPDATSEFNKFIGDINQARFNTGESLNGEVDVGKLMPGKSDFYDALASMGDPIGALAAKVEKLEMASGPDETPRFRRTEEQGRVLKWGEKTAFYVSALRGKDQDHYRLKFFKKYFKKEFDDPKLEFEIKTKEVETPKQTKGDKAKGGGKKAEMKPEKVSLIDFDKTIESYREKIENFEERLMDANEKFMAIEKEMDGEKVKFNEAHKKAYIASRIATAATGCTRELPRDLRKRNPLAELSLRSPKAAKSMRVKARKLGFTT